MSVRFEVEFTEKRLGISVVATHVAYAVTSSSCPGVQPGDRIVALDGVPISKKSGLKAINKNTQRPLTITFERQVVPQKSPARVVTPPHIFGFGRKSFSSKPELMISNLGFDNPLLTSMRDDGTDQRYVDNGYETVTYHKVADDNPSFLLKTDGIL